MIIGVPCRPARARQAGPWWLDDQQSGSIVVTAPVGLPGAAIRPLAGQALTRMTEDCGFTGAAAEAP
jgi:hypothetical protein